MATFRESVKKFFKTITDSDVEEACIELKRRLREKGYNPDYPPDHGNEYQSGKRVWIVLADPVNDQKEKTQEELTRCVAEIKSINMEVAKQFGLNPTGVGPLTGENALIFAYCGFKTFYFIDY